VVQTINLFLPFNVRAVHLSCCQIYQRKLLSCNCYQCQSSYSLLIFPFAMNHCMFLI